jgi:hypothetical protein
MTSNRRFKASTSEALATGTKRLPDLCWVLQSWASPLAAAPMPALRKEREGGTHFC